MTYTPPMPKITPKPVQTFMAAYTAWNTSEAFTHLAVSPRAASTHAQYGNYIQAVLNRAARGEAIIDLEAYVEDGRDRYQATRDPNGYNLVTAWREAGALSNARPDLQAVVGPFPPPFRCARTPEGALFDGSLVANAIRLALRYVNPHTLAHMRIATVLEHWDTLPSDFQRALRFLMWWAWQDRTQRTSTGRTITASIPAMSDFKVKHVLPSMPLGYLHERFIVLTARDAMRPAIIADIGSVPGPVDVPELPGEHFFMWSDFYTAPPDSDAVEDARGVAQLLRVPELFMAHQIEGFLGPTREEVQEVRSRTKSIRLPCGADIRQRFGLPAQRATWCLRVDVRAVQPLEPTTVPMVPGEFFEAPELPV